MCMQLLRCKVLIYRTIIYLRDPVEQVKGNVDGILARQQSHIAEKQLEQVALLTEL